MWSLTGKPKIVMATAALARTFAEMERLPHDRDFKTAKIGRLAAVMKTEEFRGCEWARCYCRETGLTYRVNGKHTSTTAAGLNGEFRPFPVLVSDYEADTLEDVARLYATFDTQDSTRNSGDINQALAASHPTLAALGRKIISLAVTGLAYAKWGTAAHGHPSLERAALMLANLDFCKWVQEIMVGDCKCIRRGPVVAAMVRTFAKSQTASKEFWAAVRDGSGPHQDCPDRKLQKYLLGISVNLGSGAIPKGKTIVSFREVFARCIHAWNAFRTNKPTELKYYADKDLPEAR